jgi:NtrC-family two-component system sensor histidine kinase KinB
MTPLREVSRQRISMIGAGLALALLAALAIAMPPNPADLLPAVLFCLLMVFTMTFGVPISQGSVSLMPMVATAAYLVLGLTLAAWLTFVSAFIRGWIIHHWSHKLGARREWESGATIARTATSAIMHALGILAGGAVFQLCGGTTPAKVVDLPMLLRLGLLGLTYLSVNYLIAGTYIATLGRAPLRSYLESLPRAAVFEGSPILFAVLIAVTLTQLGLGYFSLLALNLVVGSLIAHRLDLANRRLARRARELDGLQAVGQALSASLDVEDIVLAIYAQVARLMPAHEFYVALYDPHTEGITFPLAVEGWKRVQWRSRQVGNGLTEYVLKSGEPLLIQGDVKGRATALGLDYVERDLTCWLGVPMIAGTEPLGVIAVQSYTDPKAYDTSHQRVLHTIAAQAAIAIHNAHLYARTDESLARRVQELDSILRTTRDGFLLLDLDWRVLTPNRTLAAWVDVSQSELVGQFLDAPLAHGDSLLRLIGYSFNSFQADCSALADGAVEQKQATVLLGPDMRQVERTLIPVRDQAGGISGWLLAFRDKTEEIELERLRDDMTDMLVHDLRSPLTAVMGSVELMKHPFTQADADGFERLRLMALQNSDRILHIVNQLLDISKLESGQIPLQPLQLDVETLFREAQARFTPLATEARIQLDLEIAPHLPPLYVDRALINRVLDNLLDNAIKFTPDGGRVRMWARCDPRLAPDGLLVGVSDDGPGIAPEARHRLFTKFQQVTTIEGRRSGTGLGLAFCRLAVEAHGGRIWVESELGQGSTFLMSLPTNDTEHSDRTGETPGYESRNRTSIAQN